MSVESWNPKSENLPNSASISRMLRASGQSVDDDFGLSSEEVKQFSKLMQVPLKTWRQQCGDLNDSELLSLIKFFTLAEQKFSTWQAGDRSPVIALARELRERGDYPQDLNAWIKDNSDNRFLPHGSLMDRL